MKKQKLLIILSVLLVASLMLSSCNSAPDWEELAHQDVEQILVKYGSGNVEFHIDKLTRYLTEEAVIFYFEFHGVADYSTEEEPNQIEDFGTYYLYYYDIYEDLKLVHLRGRIMMNNEGDYQPEQNMYIVDAYEAAKENNKNVYEYTAEEMKAIEEQMTFLPQ